MRERLRQPSDEEMPLDDVWAEMARLTEELATAPDERYEAISNRLSQLAQIDPLSPTMTEPSHMHQSPGESRNTTRGDHE